MYGILQGAKACPMTTKVGNLENKLRKAIIVRKTTCNKNNQHYQRSYDGALSVHYGQPTA